LAVTKIGKYKRVLAIILDWSLPITAFAFAYDLLILGSQIGAAVMLALGVFLLGRPLAETFFGWRD
jgi:hypothetical protein